MADENTQAGKICPGDCLQCTRAQQLYCASQGNIEIHKGLDNLTSMLKTLDEKVTKVVDLFSQLIEKDEPAQVVKKGKAPKSSGADNKS